MNKGTQIAYIPRHANGNIRHRDVEFGFVMKPHRTCANASWCRFWRRGRLGELRTLANSELTFDDDLVEHESVPQAVVEETIALIES